jgi:hypothetical protein
MCACVPVQNMSFKQVVLGSGNQACAIAISNALYCWGPTFKDIDGSDYFLLSVSTPVRSEVVRSCFYR